MNWEGIIAILAGCAFVGDILMRLLFKSKRRIDDAEADSAEAKANAEEWQRYKEELANYHTTIDTLQRIISQQAQQMGTLIKDHTAERAELEQRFNNQTDRLRDVQREHAACQEREVEYAKKIGDLKLELERKRCDDLPCPFRQPPNAHTKDADGLTKDNYFKNRKK